MSDSPGGMRATERRTVFGVFLLLAGIVTGHMVLQTVRDTLFLTKLPVTALAWVYLGIAGLAVAVSTWEARRHSSRRGSSPSALGLYLAVGGVVTAGFWPLVEQGHQLALYALYVWSAIFGSFVTTRFWLVLGRVFTVSQAKRLYSFVAAGGTVGAILGGGFAAGLMTWLPARDVLLVAAGIMVLLGFVCARVLRMPTSIDPDHRDTEGTNIRSGLAATLTHPYARHLGALVILTTLAVTLGDFLFKREVTALAGADIGPFLGKVYSAVAVASLIFQLTLTNVLMRWLGATRVVWLMPSAMLVASLGVFFGGGLVAAIGLKGSDEGLRHTVHKTAIEVLYLPLPTGVREQAKQVFDIAGHRLAQALASMMILGFVWAQLDIEGIVVVLMLTLVSWLGMAVSVKRGYLDQFRAALRRGSVATVGGRDAPLDVTSLEALIVALNSQSDGEVLMAIETLSRHGRGRLISTMTLYHPSTPVVVRTLELFANEGRTDFLPVAARLADHGDPEIRAAALRARSVVAPDREVLDAARQDPAVVVRATAVVGLVHLGAMGPEDVVDAVGEFARSGDKAAKLALLAAIERQPSPAFDDVLVALADDDSRDVVRAVARAMAAAGRVQHLPSLLLMLAHRSTRTEARKALIATGWTSLKFLERALADEELPKQIRIHIPRTISAFPARQALPILLRRLPHEKTGMVHYKILRGLGRIKIEHPELRFDPRPVQEAIDAHMREVFGWLHVRTVLEAAPHDKSAAEELLIEMLQSKERHGIGRLLRLHGLLGNYQDLRSIRRGLKSSDSLRRSSSHELLEELLEGPSRDAMLALVAEVSDQSRLAGAGEYYKPESVTYAEVVSRMSHVESSSLREIARYVDAQASHHETSVSDTVDAERPNHRKLLERAMGLLDFSMAATAQAH